MIKFVLFAICFLAHLSSTFQVSIECDYSTYTYEVLGNVYRCNVKNAPNIINLETANVTSTFGVHQSGRSNNDVIGFHAAAKNLQFFPKGLEKNFKNMKLIFMFSCKLKEVHQADLKPFPNLVYIYLFSNQIEVIEPGLFDFNPNLEYISVGDNRIAHVDANVFDGLTKLWHLHLNSVPCYDKYVCSYSQTQDLIRELKQECKDADFVDIDDKMKKLADEAGSLAYHDFNTKVVAVGKQLVRSQYSSNSYLKDKFEALKFMKASSTSASPKPQTTAPTCTNCCQIDQLSSLDMKVGNMTDILATLKPFQDVMDSQLSGITLLVREHGSKLDEVQTSQESIEARLSNFEVRVNEQFEAIKQELAVTRHKMEVNLDEKVKGIEKRLVKKFEDMLERMLNDKLG